jgi:hypothetical protein
MLGELATSILCAIGLKRSEAQHLAYRERHESFTPTLVKLQASYEALFEHHSHNIRSCKNCRSEPVFRKAAESLLSEIHLCTTMPWPYRHRMKLGIDQAWINGLASRQSSSDIGIVEDMRHDLARVVSGGFGAATMSLILLLAWLRDYSVGMRRPLGIFPALPSTFKI